MHGAAPRTTTPAAAIISHASSPATPSSTPSSAAAFRRTRSTSSWASRAPARRSSPSSSSSPTRASDRPILYLTTLSEPLAKVVRYLQQFSFFDEEKLGVAARSTRTRSPRARRRRRRRARPDAQGGDHDAVAEDHRHRLVQGGARPRARRCRRCAAWSTSCRGLLTAYDTTAFLLGEYTRGRHPALAGVRGGRRHRRAVARSSRATATSATCASQAARQRLPRGRARVPHHRRRARRLSRGSSAPTCRRRTRRRRARVSTGVAGLDAMLDGGLWRGGDDARSRADRAPARPRSRCSSSLEGVERGEPGLYMNFQENPTQLARSDPRVSASTSRRRRAQGLHLLYASPVELQIDSIIVEHVPHASRRRGVRRVVIDALGDLVGAASDPQRLLRATSMRWCSTSRCERVASVLTLETTAEGGKPMEGQLGGAVRTARTVLKDAPRAGWRQSSPHPAHHQGGEQPRPNIRELQITSKEMSVV